MEEVTSLKCVRCHGKKDKECFIGSSGQTTKTCKRCRSYGSLSDRAKRSRAEYRRKYMKEHPEARSRKEYQREYRKTEKCKEYYRQYRLRKREEKKALEEAAVVDVQTESVE